VKLLVRAPNWVGDAVLSLPALRALRRAFPEAHLAVLARAWVAPLYRRESAVDEVLLHTAAPGPGDWRGKWRLARALRSQGFDCAILLQNAFEAALVARLAGIRRRIGYARDARGFLLTDPIAAPRPGEIPRHEVYYYLELLRRARILEALPEVRVIELDAAAHARERGRRRLEAAGLSGQVIGVSPGAAFGGAKRWPPDRFASAARLVAPARAAAVAVFGSPGDRSLCDGVAAGLERAGVAVRNFAGETTLDEFIELAAACSLFLTNDSGAMHIAAALGVPTVALFGPTDPWATGPVAARARVVREPLDCSPCKLRECPIDHRCMTRITPEAVAEAALDLLEF
jgi:heptosyltransferase-2